MPEAAAPARKLSPRAAAKAAEREAVRLRGGRRVAGPKVEHAPPVEPIPPDPDRDLELDQAIAEALDAEVIDPEIVDPAYEAFLMARAGVPYTEIARRTDYNSAGAVKSIVSTFMLRAAAEQAADRRIAAFEMSVARHEALIEAHWSRATELRDPANAMVVSRELAAIDKIQRNGELDDSAAAGRAIVIAGSPEEYLAGLQAIVAGDTPLQLDAGDGDAA